MRTYHNCHTPKYVENPQGQSCCTSQHFLASTWPHVYSIPQNTGFFTTVTLPNMLKTLKAKTAVIPTIFLLQHGHMSILSQKTQGFRILSQARLARANAMMVRCSNILTNGDHWRFCFGVRRALAQGLFPIPHIKNSSFSTPQNLQPERPLTRNPQTNTLNAEL